MKRLLALIVLAGISAGAMAQQGGQTFTLDQAIQYALENSTATKNATLDQLSAKARVKEITGLGLPQVNGSASVVHNEKLPRFFMSYSTQGGFIDFGEIQGVQEGDVIAAPNFFQLKNSGDASVTVNQLIFNGSYFVGLKAAKALKELTKKSADYTNETVVYNVTVAYYAVLINQEQVSLFNSNIARVDTLLRDTKAMFNNGFAEAIDVDRIQVTLNNLKTERDNFLNLNALGLELLKFQMNYPMKDAIAVTGKVEDLQVNMDTSFVTGFDYKNRRDYQVTEVNKSLQQLNIRNLYAQSLPTLGAFGTVGYSTQSNTLSGVFKTNTGIQSSEMVGPDKWYNYSLFGVSLNVPLFSGFQQSNKIKQQKYELEKIENNQQNLRQAIDLEIRTATITFENSLNSLENFKANVALAENVARVTKIKYEQGVGPNSEVVDAETALKEAQISYYNALYNVVIAKVDLDKAYGKLAVPTTQK